jgi:hypothetical protein
MFRLQPLLLLQARQVQNILVAYVADNVSNTGTNMQHASHKARVYIAGKPCSFGVCLAGFGAAYVSACGDHLGCVPAQARSF